MFANQYDDLGDLREIHSVLHELEEACLDGTLDGLQKCLVVETASDRR